jgi:hypothetical protein
VHVQYLALELKVTRLQAVDPKVTVMHLGSSATAQPKPCLCKKKLKLFKNLRPATIKSQLFQGVHRQTCVRVCCVCVCVYGVCVCVCVRCVCVCR